jgi:hypothetical protein
MKYEVSTCSIRVTYIEHGINCTHCTLMALHHTLSLVSMMLADRRLSDDLVELLHGARKIILAYSWLDTSLHIRLVLLK